MSVLQLTESKQTDQSDISRLRLGLLLSLLVHVLLLSLQFGGDSKEAAESSEAGAVADAVSPPLQIRLQTTEPPVPQEKTAQAVMPPVPALQSAVSAPEKPAETRPAVRTGIQLVELPKPAVVKEANAEKAQARPARAIKKVPVAAKKGMPDAAPLIIAQDRFRVDSFTVANPHPDDPVKTPGTTEQGSDAPQKVAVSAEVPKTIAEPETKPEAEPETAPAKYVPAPEKVQARQKTLAPDLNLLATTTSNADLTKAMQSDVKVQADEIRTRIAAEQKQLREQEAAKAREAQRLAEQQLAEQRVAEQRKAEAQRVQQSLARLDQMASAILVNRKPEPVQDTVAQHLQEQMAAERELRRQRTREQANFRVTDREQQEQIAVAAKAPELPKREAEAVQSQLDQQAAASRQQQKEEMRRATENRLAQMAAAQAEAGRLQSKPVATGTGTEGKGSGVHQDGSAATPKAGVAQGGGSDPLATGTSKGNEAVTASPGDFASRLRDQARGLNLLKGAPPTNMLTEGGRRKLYLGATERSVNLRMYAESITQKWERNGNLNYSDSARNKSRGDAVVTVVIRKDGSVEEVVIHRSSGSNELDQAIRNIAKLNARYAIFPEAISADYDVLEIRKVWRFDERLSIGEEWR
jgi:TonB family protein